MLSDVTIDVCFCTYIKVLYFAIAHLHRNYSQLNKFFHQTQVLIFISSVGPLFLLLLLLLLSLLFPDCFFSVFFDDKLLFSIRLFGVVSAVSVDFFCPLALFCIEIWCAFLYSHLYHMFAFWNMFDQDDLNRNISQHNGCCLAIFHLLWTFILVNFSQLQIECPFPQAMHEQTGFLPVFQLAKCKFSRLCYLLHWSFKPYIFPPATVSNPTFCMFHFLKVSTLSCSLLVLFIRTIL